MPLHDVGLEAGAKMVRSGGLSVMVAVSIALASAWLVAVKVTL